MIDVDRFVELVVDELRADVAAAAAVLPLAIFLGPDGCPVPVGLPRAEAPEAPSYLRVASAMTRALACVVVWETQTARMVVEPGRTIDPDLARLLAGEMTLADLPPASRRGELLVYVERLDRRREVRAYPIAGTHPGRALGRGYRALAPDADRFYPVLRRNAVVDAAYAAGG